VRGLRLFNGLDQRLRDGTLPVHAESANASGVPVTARDRIEKPA
jgi:hypothetical protein